ncbi:MAG: hypothetical protein ACK5UP_13545, partial [Bacteroidota bacterium]
MSQKLHTFFKVALLSLCLSPGFAASISFSGETQVCPGQDYTYSASASNLFGSRAGGWEWTFWRNSQLIGSFGYIVDCPSPPGTSTSTVKFNWGNTLGAVKIRIRFKGVNDPLCQFTSPDEKWIDVNVRVLSPGPISGLAFCGPNETRIFSVPGILPFNSAQSCYYHYKYDWLVPNGWSVVPATGDGYISISGGIRTFATSVRVTTPSTPLLPKNDGNYNVIVRSEPVWPWPVESSGKIWIGSPPADNSTLIWTGVRGTEPVTVGAGSTNQYRCDQVPYADSYTWILPTGFTAVGGTTTTSPFINITSSNRTGTYTLYCRVNNGTCFSYTRSLTINVPSGGGGGGGGCPKCGGGGGGIQMRTAFPNPANDSFIIKLKEEDNREVAEVALFNKNME